MTEQSGPFALESGFWVGVARMSGWDQPFEDPVILPDGKSLPTLRHAAHYIQNLPKAEHDKSHWRTAIECLMLAAEDRGPMMHARIGMLQALRGEGRARDDPERPLMPAKRWGRRR